MDIDQITESNTRRALESVRRAASLRGNPLLEMTALRSRLRARGSSITEASLELVLFGLIQDVVEAQRRALRGVAAPNRAAVAVMASS